MNVVRMKSVVVMIAALALFGCQDRPKTEEPAKPASSAAMPQGHPPVAGEAQKPAGDPHAGLKATEVPAGAATKKATVLQTIDADIYTYIEAKGDDGKSVWMALPKTSVAKGANIEYPVDAMPMTNFTSKTLNRTFETILFVQGIKIVK